MSLVSAWTKGTVPRPTRGRLSSVCDTATEHTGTFVFDLPASLVVEQNPADALKLLQLLASTPLEYSKNATDRDHHGLNLLVETTELVFNIAFPRSFH